MNETKPKRRWFRFSFAIALADVLIAMLAVNIGLHWYMP